jgi:hypothetical protein
VNYAALRVSEQEQAFATRLLELIPSPRAANRFTNVYRLLKARLSYAELQPFEGDPSAPGDFRAVMFLLGLMTSFPNSAAGTFAKLLGANEQQSTSLFFGDVLRAGVHASDHAAFELKVLPLLDQLPADLKPFVDWAPQVARFSFNAGKALSEVGAGDAQ